ncbi:probable G-protein coupled receptor 101 [Dendronephthya gigantea]|uniref:probable G-protein coupled receptor 101 n=1 Tax=Dendronephthya gigantea TaxID=151771 RepID=UPI00106A4AAD|nr:probable G-protein coupled receptor 101 [Dendronephthya gigantea]
MFNVSNTTDEREVEDCLRSYIVTRPTTSYIVNSAIRCVVNLIIFFAGSFLNALVVYVFWKTPRLRQKVSYFMIMLLSSIDFLVTLIVLPANLAMTIAEMVGKGTCIYKLVYYAPIVLLVGMSVLVFFVMNIERYLSIVHPIFHLRHVTKLRCLVVCIMLWCLAIFCVLVVYLLRSKTQWVMTVVLLIVILGTCYIYIAIFYIAKKKKLNIRKNKTKQEKTSNTLTTSDSRNMDCVNSVTETRSMENLDNIERQDHSGTATNNQKDDQEGENSEKSSKTVSFLHDLQLAKMYFLVVLCTFALNLPDAIFLAVFHDNPKTINSFIQGKQWSVTLLLFNSTANCLIFFWANKRLRKEGWKVCKRICRR